MDWEAVSLRYALCKYDLTGFRWDITGTRIFPVAEERDGCDHIHPTVLMRMKQGYTTKAKLPNDWKVQVAGNCRI